jgi:hypothetical protein
MTVIMAVAGATLTAVVLTRGAVVEKIAGANSVHAAAVTPEAVVLATVACIALRIRQQVFGGDLLPLKPGRRTLPENVQRGAIVVNFPTR